MKIITEDNEQTRHGKMFDLYRGTLGRGWSTYSEQEKRAIEFVRSLFKK